MKIQLIIGIIAVGGNQFLSIDLVIFNIKSSGLH